MHLTGLYFPVTAIAGLFLGWFGEDEFCYIADATIKWKIAGIPMMFVYLSLIINYGAIYVIVRKSLQSSEHVVGSTLSVQKRIKKETTILMFSYVAAFFVCVTPNFVQQNLEISSGYTRHDSKLYPVRVLNAMLLPLMGFFNFFIYIKPAYTRFRAANPTKSMRFVLHQALFNSKTPRLYRRRNANHHTYHSDVLITDITLGEDNAINLNQALFDPGQFSPDDDDDVADGDSGRLSPHPEESEEGEKEPDLTLNEDANNEGPNTIHDDHCI